MIKIDFCVSIVIPTYNGLHLLKKNFPSIEKAYNNKLNKILEVILIDNGSTDGTSDYIKKYFSWVKIIRYEVNKIFIYPINDGVRQSKGKYVALLNNDVVVESDFLESSLKILKNENIFGVSFHEKGYGPNFGKFKNGYIVHEGQKELDKVSTTFWVSGGSGIFNRNIFIKLGLMDELLLYPFYWEDVDICYRALKRGYQLIWDPSAKVIHNHESTTKIFSSSYRSKIQERNQLRFIWKNLTSPNLLKEHIKGLAIRLIKHPGYLIVVILALGKIWDIKKLRLRELKESKISDEAIFATFNS